MATIYVKCKGDPLIYKVTYTLGPVWEDKDGVRVGWYRNSFQPQPVDATWSVTADIQVGPGQSAQYAGGSFIRDASGSSNYVIAIPDEMQDPPVAPRTLEHGMTFLVFYGSIGTAVAATRSGNTMVVGSGHPFLNGQLVTVASTGTPPAGSAANTLYYVVDRTSTAISLALTPGGSALTLSDAGTGTHTVVPFGRVGHFDAADKPKLSNEEPLGIL